MTSNEQAPADPVPRLLGRELLPEVLEEVGALAKDVPAELLPSVAILSFEEAVASADAVSAAGRKVRRDVVSAL